MTAAVDTNLTTGYTITVGTTGGSISAVKPSAVVAGDYVLACISLRVGTAPTLATFPDQAGFTTLYSVGGASVSARHSWVGVRKIDGGEGANFAFDWSSIGGTYTASIAGVFRITGADATTFLDTLVTNDISYSDTGSGWSLDPASVTTTEANVLLIGIYLGKPGNLLVNDDTVFPAGQTKVYRGGQTSWGGSTSAQLALSFQVQAAAGASGAKQWKLSTGASVFGSALNFGVKSAAALNPEVTLASPGTGVGYIDAVAPLVTGNKLEWIAVTSPGGYPVTVNANASFTISGNPPDGSYTFDVRAWDGVWGPFATQTAVIAGGVVVGTPPNYFLGSNPVITGEGSALPVRLPVKKPVVKPAKGGGSKARPAGAQQVVVFTDNFDRANGAMGANWTQVTNPNTLQVLSNQLAIVNNQPGSARANAVLANNQYCKIKAVTVPTAAPDNESAFLYVRWNGTAGYFIQWTTTYFRLARDPGDVFLANAGAQGVAINDIIEIGIIGTTISCKINGVEKISFVDATHAAGSAGVRVNIFGVSLANGKLDDFECGNIV